MTLLDSLLRFAVFLCSGLLACVLTASALAATPLDAEGEAIATRIERQLEAGTVDEAGAATLAAAKKLLQSAKEHRLRVDDWVAAAAAADATIAALEIQTVAARNGAVLSQAGRRDEAEIGPRIELTAERDMLDGELARLRLESVGLDSRAEIILSALSTQRSSSSERGVLDTDSHRGAETRNDSAFGSDHGASLLGDARRYERAVAMESLQRELGTLAPRIRIAAARQRLLETRRSALSRALERAASKEETARLSAIDASVARLQAAQARADEWSVEERASIDRALLHANAVREQVRKAIALRGGDANLERKRSTLIDAEASTNGALASGATGEKHANLLMQLRREIPDPASLESALTEIRRALERLRLERVLSEDALRHLAVNPPVVLVAELLAEDGELPLLRLLLDTTLWRAERLDRRILLLNETVDRAHSLTARLDRQLLWLRKSESFRSTLVSDILAGVEWLGQPGSWSHAIAVLVDGVKAKPFRTLLGMALFIGLFAFRRALKMRQTYLSSCVGNVGRDGYWVTPLAIALAIPIALPVPVALASLAWPLIEGARSGSLPYALGVGLGGLGAVLVALDFFRVLARKEGVIVTHFGWHPEAARLLHRGLNRLIGVAAPVTVLLSMTIASENQAISQGLGLIAFVIGSLALGRFVWILCRPRTGMLAVAVPRERSSVVMRLLVILLVAVPIVVGLLPLAGYFDAALVLQTLVFRSGLLVLLGAVLYGLLLRLYAVSLRRYSLRWAREQRAERARLRGAALGGEALPSIVADEALAPEPLAGQARAAIAMLVVGAVAVGLWWQWLPLLPALGIADEVVLWNGSIVVDGASVDSPVTLWSLLLAFAFVIGGVLASRNLRGLLQVGILQRLDLDPGTRYAVTTIVGYVVFGAGLVVGLAQLGIDWSKLQWIIAALGVGLGFGLQEVVANFVSGIIILFERPVRVGDTVTIGELSGTVSDISIRATTITDFEKREVLLPNKAIITDTVTNWTLHDAITRLLIPIGVAYGSDVAAVRELLMKVVQSHPDVLALPAPTVFFVNHGASSLDFELRLFVATPSLRLTVKHDINAAINTALVDAGIVIPFPQTDVHLKVVKDGPC